MVYNANRIILFSNGGRRWLNVQLLNEYEQVELNVTRSYYNKIIFVTDIYIFYIYRDYWFNAKSMKRKIFLYDLSNISNEKIPSFEESSEISGQGMRCVKQG